MATWFLEEEVPLRGALRDLRAGVGVTLVSAKQPSQLYGVEFQKGISPRVSVSKHAYYCELCQTKDYWQKTEIAKANRIFDFLLRKSVPSKQVEMWNGTEFWICGNCLRRKGLRW